MALVTPREIAIFLKRKEAFSLDRVVDHFAGLDIVLVEGFHQEAKPKIEIRSLDHHHLRCAGDKNLLAVVEKVPSVKAVPSFTPRSIKPLADLIVKKILNSRGG